MSQLQDATSEGPARSPDTVRFFTRHYHLLKGLCYAPAGALLLLGLVTILLVRPAWIVEGGAAGLFALGLLLLSTPWAWYMHRRYEASYGAVRQSGSPAGGPVGQQELSFWVFGPLLFFGLCWIGVLHLYIPAQTAIEDTHNLVMMVGWILMLGALRAADSQSRWIYGLTGTLLFFVTLLPLLSSNLMLVQMLNYGTLGAAMLGIGLYNHRLLVDTLGPLEREVNPDE